LEKYTLFPILTFGRSAEEKAYLKRSHMEASKKAADRGAYNLASKVEIRHLNHCPECLAEQIQEFGEGYWTRTLQIPTITACPKHECKLIRTRIKNAAITPPPKETQPINRAEEWEVKHALRCEGLLQKGSTTPDEFTRRGWANLLEKGVAKIHGAGFAINKKHLDPAAASVETLWPETGLDPTHSNFRNLIRNAVEWNKSTFQSRMAILVLGDISPNDFRRKAKLPRLEFPCRNHFAACHNTLSIKKVKQLNGRRWGFYCETCGFGYSILVKDLEKNKPGKEIPSRIIKHGPVWETNFRKLWADKSLNNNEVARRCKTNLTATHRLAAILKLPARAKTPPKLREGNRPKTKKIAAYRKIWEKALKTDPNLGRSAFFLKYGTAGRFLQRHDHAWWETHLTNQLPPRNKTQKSTLDFQTKTRKTPR
jgi:hypothetical protein